MHLQSSCSLLCWRVISIWRPRGVGSLPKAAQLFQDRSVITCKCRGEILSTGPLLNWLLGERKD